MKQHWPLLIAAILMFLAVTGGMWQHDQAVAAASASVTFGSQAAAPAPTTSVLPAEKPPAPAAVPAAPITRSVAAPPAAPVAPAADPAAVPAAPVTVPAAVRNAVPAAPGAVVAPAANPAALVPQVVPPDANALPRAGRTRTLNEIRMMLQGKLGVQPTDLAAGGFAVSIEGVRVEVQPPPTWSVSIYNNNPKAPQEETPNFKVCLETVAAGLAIDLTPKPEPANGKTYVRTTCKLGSISMVRDPATGNSCTIRPIGPQAAPAAGAPANGNPNAAPKVIPAPVQHKPKIPEGPPVAPPRPPATDANF